MRKWICGLIALIILTGLAGLVGCSGDQQTHTTHEYGEWQIVKAATCTQPGEQKRTCGCGAEETQEVPALGHKEVVDEAQEATCTKTGKTEGSHCSVCGTVLKAQQIVPITHQEEVLPAVEATCTRAGKSEGVQCALCGKILTRQKKIQATGHRYQNGVCGNCGKKQPDTAAAIVIDQLNEGAPANFITKKAYAGGSTVSFNAYVPQGTGWWAVSWTTDPSDIGLYTWADGKGSLMSAGTDAWQHCTVTLPEDGKSYYIYIVGAKGEWNGKELLIDDVKITAPDGQVLGEDGFGGNVGDGLFSTVQVNPTNGMAVVYSKEVCAAHSTVIDAAVEATCTEDGRTEGSHCASCGKVLKAQSVVPATGHKWVERKCSVCGQEQEDLAAAIVIDQLSESAPMNFITKQAYPGGSTVTFNAYVPQGASWWAVSWTTDPNNTDLYQWNAGLGQSMASKPGRWAQYTVTLPDDGKSYYIYFVGAKGEWNGKELLLDSLTIQGSTGNVIAEDSFDDGLENGLFQVVRSNPTSGETVVYCKTAENPCKDGHTLVIDAAIAPTCTQPGKTEGSHCSVCGTVLKEQTEIPASGHRYENGVCTVCGDKLLNRAAAINIDQLNESAPMNFITKQAYPGGSTVTFNAYVPAGTSWWAVSWTTDPSDTDLYKWTGGLGKVQTSVYDAWAQYTVTLPDDGNSYYIYIVGAKGEWNGKELLLDDFSITGKNGELIAEDNFDLGLQNGLFNVVEKNPTTELTVIREEILGDICKHIHTAQEAGKAATCTEAGVSGRIYCTDCGATLQAEAELPAKGHHYENGVCTDCGEKLPNRAAAINIDQLNEVESMNFITKQAYAGGSTVTFSAYVPEGTAWWAVSWTTNPADTDLYKWTGGLGKTQSSAYNVWKEYTVTLPDDGNTYYIYIVGAKGEWGGKELLIDDFSITGKNGELIAEDNFDLGLQNGLFNVIEKNPTTELTVVREEILTDVCKHLHLAQEPGKEATCTEPGILGKTYCTDCGATIHEATEIAPNGHRYENGVCSVCGDKLLNRAAAVNIDQLNESAPMNFITKQAYAGGSTVTFNAYVPADTSWWAVSWTTDPADTDLYKWTGGLGKTQTSVYDAWAQYTVTLPDDGNTYYIYIVGAKGEWNGKELLIDDFKITGKDGELIAEDNFDLGLQSGLFNVVEKNPTTELTVVREETLTEACKHIHTAQEAGKAATCTEAGVSGRIYCTDCGATIHEATEIAPNGHHYENGVCTACGEKEITENFAAAIKIDRLNEGSPMSFITKQAYAGGSTVTFNAYVPADTSWWAVSWTTDPADTDLYKWTGGLGKTQTSVYDAWAQYTVTLPDDGNTYYIYIVGAKGEWNGKELLLDDFKITGKNGETLGSDDFTDGVDAGLFNIAGNDVVNQIKVE